MLNRVELIGRLTRDPELRYISAGLPMAQFSIAVDRDFRNAAGDRETDFIRCVTWRKLAEQVGQYCAKGRLVAVEGRMQTRSYELPDGSRRHITEVVGDRVWFLDSRRAASDGESAQGDQEQHGDREREDARPELLGDAEEREPEPVTEP